jgi:hypothetical protein
MQYIADLRAYLASSLGFRPGEVRLFSMGKEYDDDSLQLADLFSSVVEKLSFHMHKVKLGLYHVSSQPPEVQDLVAKTCPDVLMGQHPTLTATLIYLLDFPVGEHGAHSTAYAVLARLETSPELLQELQQAQEDASPEAGGFVKDSFSPAVRRVLNVPVPLAPVFQQRPGALLYTLEAIFALMQPATSCTPGAPHSFAKALLLYQAMPCALCDSDDRSVRFKHPTPASHASACLQHSLVIEVFLRLDWIRSLDPVVL